MHGLQCRGLEASIRGCIVKNSFRKPRSGLIKECYLPRTIFTQLNFNKFFFSIIGGETRTGRNLVSAQ
jgi:hypothetical protein